MSDDQQTRLDALNIQKSFLVQAPAGSGKTELLTQRFLKLLSVVNAPEEIIAITFTRKAAAQMRQRILTALTLAAHNKLPKEPHKQLTVRLATAALKRDQQRQWHIIDNPNRLRILTIDALAGFLSAQIPILAGFGSQPDITEHAELLYEEAARELVNSITEDNLWKTHIETLLLHLDNQAERVIELLCAILAKREQWLPHILNYHGNSDLLHQHLEQSLIHIAQETIEHAHKLLDHHLDELLALMKHAASNLSASGDTQHSILTIQNITQLKIDYQQLEAWQALTSLLLTQKETFRKSVDKRHGFLPKTMEKERIGALLATFREDELLRDALVNLHYCPPPYYPASQKAMLEALTQLLPILYAQLRLVFQKHNAIDFVELNLAALRALGSEAEPTNLALYLDYQIQHLLVDEFQDTSITQYTLLERLTYGWEPHDGRSLFLVGDPMQSIYRFRDAEVGLFIRAQTQHINSIFLNKLTLRNNYRSDKTIIDWINNTFEAIFPKKADITQGAVPYKRSLPTQDFLNQSVRCYALVDHDAAQEAQTVVKTIQELHANHPHDSIAILVRSRNQLRAIIPLLHQQQLAFEAVDLETLIDCSEIQDLLTLTRVVAHRQDRIAWLALLRSPICGLTLHDLFNIANHSPTYSIWQNMIAVPKLSADGRRRLARITTLLTLYFNEQGRKPFELALKGLWQALGYSELLSAQQLTNANHFFKLLAAMTHTTNSININDLTKNLSQTYIEPQKSTSNLSIMTIHKSKGLEFDHVILPGLQAQTGSDKHDLMLWLERPNWQGTIDFILAPIKHAHQDNDPIYRYLQRVEKRKLDFEAARLLYVATTRARKSLYLSACLCRGTDDTLQFKTNSFSALLKDKFSEHTPQQKIIDDHETTVAPLLSRVTSNWQPQCRLPIVQTSMTDNPLPTADSYVKRSIGIVIHELLADNSKRTLDYARLRLQQHLPKAQLPQALDIIQLVLINIQHDPRAQWILSSAHQDAHNEYPISTVINNKVKHLIIDRLFVDNDVRWIIDYKTTTPSDEPHEHFLKQQLALYRDQLILYAQALRGVEQREIRTALYFPVCKLWIENTPAYSPQTSKSL